jgi:hypothetical protein
MIDSCSFEIEKSEVDDRMRSMLDQSQLNGMTGFSQDFKGQFSTIFLYLEERDPHFKEVLFSVAQDKFNEIV